MMPKSLAVSKVFFENSSLLRIAKYLMEQKTFPDLYDWEDSEKKIWAAHDAVSKLRIYHERQEQEIESEEQGQKVREHFRKRQDDISRSHQTSKASLHYQTCPTG
jgi:hypothetical protein